MREKNLHLAVSYLLLFNIIYLISVTLAPKIENVFSREYLDTPVGIASGDVTSNSVILWSKTNASSLMNIVYSLEPNFHNYMHNSIYVNHTNDYTGHYKVDNLIHNSTYYYKIWFSDPINSSLATKAQFGKFKTAPLSDAEESINFAVGGDVGGQGFCRKVSIGYPLFSVINGFEPNFFVANGDMIYADNTCPKKGPNDVFGWKNIPGFFPSILDYSVDWNNVSEVYSVYKAHWDYNKADKHMQNLYKNIPVYSLADDHEVADNYDGDSEFYSEYHNRSGFKNIVHEGLRAFFNYSPLESFKEEPNRIYRSFNWGAYLDIFILDSHQYRTEASIEDSSSTNKTVLGTPQLEWLKNSVKNSKAVWKVILNDVPVTIPNCYPDSRTNKTICDTWATNNKSNATFTRERDDFMRYLDKHDLKNVIFITTDVHYSANVLVDDDFDEDGNKLRFYEFTSGPLSAKTVIPKLLDPTINATYLYNGTGFFNFGYYEINKLPLNKTLLTSQVVNGDGLVIPGSKMEVVSE